MSQTPMVATITKASGSILVERAGQALTLQQGDALHVTDVIHTQNAAIECLFTDGSKVLLGPQSVLTVQEFIFSSEGSSCVLNLSLGIMRSISGAIVEQSPDSFKLITPKATVDICGSDFGIKVNADKSEAYVVFSIDPGQNLVLTIPEGNALSLTGAGQGALIDVDDLSTMQSYIFTPEEIYDFLGALFNLTDRTAIEEAHRKLWEEENAKSAEPISLLLEQNNLSSWATEGSFQFSQANVATVLSSRINAGQIVKAVALGTVTLADNVPAAGPGGSNIFSVSGDNNYFADGAAYTNGSHALISQTFTVSGDIHTGSVISGDAQTITGGNIVAGNDTIGGGHISSGTVVGDAYSISGTNTKVQAGQDSITFISKTGGNSIYGDAYEVKEGAIVNFGHDTITIKGDFSHTTIAGDAFTVSDASAHTWGNDVISVGHMTATTAHTTIYGDSSSSTEYGGADTITVHSMSGAGVDAHGAQLTSSIHAGGGNDFITVGTLGENAFIYGDGGDDIITVNAFAGGTIDGGAGDDSITVTPGSHGAGSSGGVIKVDEGNDTIHIKPLGDTTVIIDGFNLSNDVFMVDGVIFDITDILTTGSGVIYPDDPSKGWAINLTFTNASLRSSPNLNHGLDESGNTGSHTEIYTYASHDNFIENTFSDEMSGDVQSINVEQSDNVYFGNDTLSFTTFTGTVYGDVEEADAKSLTFGNDSIVVQYMQGGNIYGDTTENYAPSDSIFAGNDTIIISQSMSGGEIYGGFGKDSIDIQGFLKGDVYFAHGGEDSISLNITSTTKDDANIHLGTEAGDTTHITLSSAVENSTITLHDFDIDGSDGSRDYLYDATGTGIEVTQSDLTAGSKDIDCNGNTLTVYFS